MGMTLLLKLDFPDSKFSLFFLGYHPEADIPEDPAERVRVCSGLAQPLTDMPVPQSVAAPRRHSAMPVS